MIWFLLLIVLFAFMMGFFQVPIWIMYGVLVGVLILILYRNPLIFGKDAEKIMAYLKKSKAPYMQFLFHFLNGDLSAAEQVMGKIRSKKSKRNSELMLLMEKKQYGKAKELLREMGGHKTKWYALSDIAIKESDLEAFKQNKAKITDTFF
ncbi:hypothetical protein V7139_07265 [Neobacillus drentensis]